MLAGDSLVKPLTKNQPSVGNKNNGVTNIEIVHRGEGKKKGISRKKRQTIKEKITPDKNPVRTETRVGKAMSKRSFCFNFDRETPRQRHK
jgi:hypothetical protein